LKNDRAGYGEEIPLEIYDAAAQLIRFLEKLDEEYAGEGRIRDE